MQLLIVDDDPVLGELIAEYCASQGYEAVRATGGHEALQLIALHRPDLIVLDVMMPDMDGWDVIEQLRKSSDVPVLFLTAKGTPEDTIKGLKLGADDYVRKPVSFEELGLRIAAILRRARPGEVTSESFDDGRLRVDTVRRLVSLDGRPVRLTPTEYRLLSYLVRHRDRPVPREELLTEVWGPEYAEDISNLQVYIRYLREKLGDTGDTPRYIHTTWGVGYRFGSFA